MHNLGFTTPIPAVPRALGGSICRGVKNCRTRTALLTRAKMEGTAMSTKTGHDVEADIRDELKAMDAYVPIVPYDVLAERLGRPVEDIVKLDANENPFGPSPAAARALTGSKYLHIYPDPESGSLRTALADYTGVPMEHLLVGAGADELIDLLFRLFVQPGVDSVVNLPPTFGMYRFDADVNGASIVSIPRDADFKPDIDAVERVFETNRPKLIFVASPNNPDGSVLSESDLLRLLALPAVVVLDEAYAEFATSSRIDWVLRHDNLVVLRTFSKWAGLAGLRVGYGAFPLAVIKHLWKIKQPYNVSVAGQVAAEASLLDRDDLLDKVEKMKAARERFQREITRFDWLSPYPSESNFVLCLVSGGRNAADVKQKLAERGILIRYYTSKGLADCVRFSMGTESQMERLYAALAEL